MERYWTGQIGDVVLEEAPNEPCGFQLTGADGFEVGFVSSGEISPDGFGHFYYTPQNYGHTLAIGFIHVHGTVLRAVLDLLKSPAIIPGGGSVPCTFQDGFQTITGNFRPDMGEWYKRGEPDGD